MYKTVYDVNEAIPWGDLGFVAFGAFVMAVGVWMWLLATDRLPPGIIEALERMPRRKRVAKPALRTSSFVMMAFGLLWLLVTGTGIIGGWYTYRAALDTGAHERVEGVVENFEPERRDGSGDESFTVQGLYFEYSAYRISPAFKKSQVKGGPIREGLPVRIAYFPRDRNNAILKLEIPTSEPAAAPTDESTQRPALPIGLFMSLAATLSIVIGWLLFFNRNTALKRRLFPVLMVLAALLVIAFGLESGSSPLATFVVIPVMLFYLWVIRFCDACGATVVPQGSWRRPTQCHSCGQALDSK